MKDFFPESLGQKHGCTLYTAKYGTFFSTAHGTFSKIDHVLGYKTSLNTFKKIKITLSIFSDLNSMKPEISHKKKLKNTQRHEN